MQIVNMVQRIATAMKYLTGGKACAVGHKKMITDWT